MVNSETAVRRYHDGSNSRVFQEGPVTTLLTEPIVLNAPGLAEAQAKAPAKREFKGRHCLCIRLLSGKITYSPKPPRRQTPKTEGLDPDLGVASYSIEPDGSMGLLPVLISRKPAKTRAPRGSHGLTRNGKKLIEDGLIYLYEKFKGKKESLVFWTTTIPTFYSDGTLLTEVDQQKLLQGWPEICRRTFEELGRELARLGLPKEWLYVVELQDRFMPHIHAIFPNRFKNSWRLHYSKTDEIWQRALSNFLGKEVEISAACRLEPIHGLSKLSDYLQKFQKIGNYMGKGSQVLESAKKAGIPIPSSWYGSDLETKQEVRGRNLSLTVENTSISELEEAIQSVDSELGKEIFTPVFRIEIDAVEWQVSGVCQVKNLADREKALAHLIWFFRDTS